MLSIAAHLPHLRKFAMDHDTLGWDNFLQGRVARKLFLLVKESLCAAGSRMRLQTWSKFFLRHLINITHRQWLYRNARIHIRKLEGKTEREHTRIMEEVRDMMLVDPSDLLPCHRHLLRQDYERLGEGTTVDRQYWLAQMTSAVSAAETTQQRYELTSTAGTGNIRTRGDAGLDITARSNLAKRTRL